MGLLFAMCLFVVAPICGLLVGTVFAISTRIACPKPVRFWRGFGYASGACLIAFFAAALLIPFGLLGIPLAALASLVFMVAMLVNYEELNDSTIIALSIFSTIVSVGLTAGAFMFINAAGVMGMGP